MGNVIKKNPKNIYITTTIIAQIIVVILLLNQAFISTLYRISYGDASYFLFQLFFTKTFFCPHGRYVDSIIEFFPLIGVWLNLGFKPIAILFTSGYTFASFVLYLIYGFYTKKWAFGWFIILVQIMGYFEGYNYYCLEHFSYTLSVFSILILDYQIDNNHKKSIYFSCLLFLIQSIINHQSSFFVLYSGLIYLFFEHNTHRKKIILLGVSFIILYLVNKNIINPYGGYESNKIYELKNNLNQLSSLDLSAFSWYYRHHYFTNSYFIVLHFVVFILCIYYKKFKLIIIGATLFLLSYYFNCFIFYKWGGQCYMELYGVMIFNSYFLGIYFLVKKNVNKWVTFILMIYIFHFNINNIYLNQIKYREREKYIDQLADIARNSDRSKIAFYNNKINSNKIEFNWSIPFESMNSSLFRNKKNISIYIYQDSSELKKIKKDEILFSLNPVSYKELENTPYNSLKIENYLIK